MSEWAVHRGPADPAPPRDPLAVTICPQCGYSIQGLPSEGTCPECGEGYDQKYIVLFGQTPHGWSRQSDCVMFVLLPAYAAVVIFMSLRHRQTFDPWLIVPLSVALVYVLLWLSRQLSVKSEIMFQVWLNEDGFVVRHAEAKMTLLAGVEHAMRYVWPVFLIPSFFSQRGQVSLILVLALIGVITILAAIRAGLDIPALRRRVVTGDARLPKITPWDANDAVFVHCAVPGVARLTISSRSYLGKWKWHEWNAVDASVRLTSDQASALRCATGIVDLRHTLVQSASLTIFTFSRLHVSLSVTPVACLRPIYLLNDPRRGWSGTGEVCPSY